MGNPGVIESDRRREIYEQGMKCRSCHTQLYFHRSNMHFSENYFGSKSRFWYNQNSLQTYGKDIFE